MLTNTIQLLNNFLTKTDFNKDSLFLVEDFNNNINDQIGIIYPGEEFSFAQKSQLISNKGISFHVDILCVAEKNKDILYAISFGSKDTSQNEPMIIVEYIHQLIIQFSNCISDSLYEGLKDYIRLEKIYLGAYTRLMLKKNQIDTVEKPYIIEDYEINRETCQLESNLYLTIFLHENGMINYLLIFGDE